MPAKEYTICTSDTPVSLGLQVTELLSQGWELYGHPFVDSRKSVDGGRSFCQAMIRTSAVSSVRPRVAVTFGNIAAFLAVILGGYLLFESLIFRTGLYAQFLEPEASAAGSLEQNFYDEAHRSPSGKKEVLVIGSSRVAEGFSAKLANQHQPQDGFWFVNFAVPGSGARVWYYLVRDIDPHRDRYAAIAVQLDDYDDFDDYEDVADRVSEVSLLMNRLRVTDILPYTMSFPTAKSRYEVFRRATLKGLEYQRDLQDFIEHPSHRLQRVADFRAHGRNWAYDYAGIPGSLSGLQVDWVHQQITFPPGMPEDRQRFLSTVFFSHPPQRGKNRAFNVRWLGALADLYRGSKTRIIVFQTPRSASPRPTTLTPLSWHTIDDLRKRPWVTVIDRNAFVSLEKPEWFADHVHLNSEGRKLFSPMLADVVKQHAMGM